MDPTDPSIEEFLRSSFKCLVIYHDCHDQMPSYFIKTWVWNYQSMGSGAEHDLRKIYHCTFRAEIMQFSLFTKNISDDLF